MHERIIKKEALFLSDEAWQHLGRISTLRATTNGVHKIHIRHVNIFFMNLSSESVVLLRQKET
jgi:hypothetical protein